MVDLILKRIWNFISEGWSNMADLADRIDDLICSFEGGAETTMDTVAMLIFGWLLFGLFVLAIGKYIYGKYFSVASAVVPEIPLVTIPVVPVAAIEAASASEEGGAVVKEKEAVVVRAAPRASGANVPPTPPLRKRISKKVSGPATSTPKASHVVTPPFATGPDSESVNWVNEVFYWLYSDLVIVNEILNVWIQSLNDYTKKSVAEMTMLRPESRLELNKLQHGVGLEFVRLLPESHAPSLANVFSECSSNDDVTITCDCEANPALQLKAFRQKGDRVEVSHYRVNVNRFRARLSIHCITEKLLADIKCDGWPDVKVSLAQVGAIKNNLDEQELQDLLSDIIVVALRNTVVNLNLGQYATCPRFDRPIMGPPPPILPVHYDSMLQESKYPSIPSKTASDRRLLVKVIKANALGADRGCREPYCVVEMDDPPQKNQTSVKKDTNCPVWDEHFLFELSPHTAELLFEIYDRANKTSKNFLGLGIVGVEELLINPSQRQIISLQSRPYETDKVSGTLTVEFLFIDGGDVPTGDSRPYKIKETLRTSSPSGIVTTTKTTFGQPGQQMTNGDVVTDSALKELELRNRGLTIPQANKSTLIIHSVHRQPQTRQVVKVEQTDTGTWQEVPDHQQGTKEELPLTQPVQEGSSPVTASDERGRARRKKRDFFGTIKKRLSRSKNRSKSMDPGERDESLNRDASLSRSISADRARDPSAGSAVPAGLRADGDGSTRSSLSEMSGVSGASTRTYVNEASTLVLETIENGIKKHYLVPLSMAQKNKWRKKGTKLHIFNDHTFIARHLPGGTICQVCNKSLVRRIGKQGYECRDCLFICHKHCHVKVDTNCTSSTIQTIELTPDEESGSLTRKFVTEDTNTHIHSPIVDRRVFQLQSGETKPKKR